MDYGMGSVVVWEQNKVMKLKPEAGRQGKTTQAMPVTLISPAKVGVPR